MWVWIRRVPKLCGITSKNKIRTSYLSFTFNTKIKNINSQAGFRAGYALAKQPFVVVAFAELVHARLFVSLLQFWNKIF